MSPLSNSSITSLMFFATLSSSVIMLPYELTNTLIPTSEVNFTKMENIADWKEKAFNTSSDYTFNNEADMKIQIIIGFSSRILDNSTNIDSEFVDIVNEHFWELI